MTFEPEAYWRTTLERFDEAATAYPWLPVEFNRALYDRWTKSFIGVVDGRPVAGRRVLDIGAGTGWLVGIWRGLGAGSIAALDIAPAAVEGLRAAGIDAHEADIGAEAAPFDRRFDIVSAASVLLHVTEPQRFERALANIGSMLEDSGFVIVVDPYIRTTCRLQEDGNSAIRSAEQWAVAAASAGLRIVDAAPLAAILANPVESRTAAGFRVVDTMWRTLERVAVRSPSFGRRLVRALGPLDRALCGAGVWPTSKIVVLEPVARR